MTFQKLIALFAAFLTMGISSTAAMAQADSYRIEANATQNTTITICNPEVRVVLTGDGDTDLDFVITNSRGETVHSDYGLSDRSTATLYRRSNVDCEDFNLRTTNLGNVWNLLDISLEDIRTNSGNPVDTNSYRIDANATQRLDLSICSPQVRLNIRGDGDTDLDFVIRNSRGEIVHSDYDLTDRTNTVLNRRNGVSCETFELTTSNLGNVYNLYVVQVEDLRGGGRAVAAPAPAAALGSQDGRNRDISIQNRTGQTIMYLYWSNVAASGWGDDRLGSGVLSNGQDWNVTVDDASGACRFDFRARLRDGRDVDIRNVDVCSIYTLQIN